MERGLGVPGANSFASAVVSSQTFSCGPAGAESSSQSVFSRPGHTRVKPGLISPSSLPAKLLSGQGSPAHVLPSHTRKGEAEQNPALGLLAAGQAASSQALRKTSDNPIVAGWRLCRERLTPRAGGASLARPRAPHSSGLFSSRRSEARSGDSSGKQEPCGRFAHGGLWLNRLTASPFRRHQQTRRSHAAAPPTAALVLPRCSQDSGLCEGPAGSPRGVVHPRAPGFGGLESC